MTARARGDRPYRRGVGAVLFNTAGKVFVGRRIDTPGGAWQLPQGGIAKGESPRQAVLRELVEEIGTGKAEIVATCRRWLRYDLPEELAAQVWGGRYRGQEQMWFALLFTGGDDDIALDASREPEFADWKWVDLESLPEIIVPFKRTLYRDLVAEFRPLAKPRAGPPKGT